MNWSNVDEVEELSEPGCTHYADNAVAVYFCPFPLNASQCFQGHSGTVLGLFLFFFLYVGLGHFFSENEFYTLAYAYILYSSLL